MHLRKEFLEARHRLAELEPAWEMFIDKNNDEEEARDQEQRRRAAVTAQPSERRIRGPKDARADSAAEISHLATPRGADNVLSGSASTLGMFSSVSTGLESARELDPSSATVDSDAAHVTELNRGVQRGRVQETHKESTGSSSAHPLRREELIPDSTRKTTLANLETKALKAFRNIFAHNKNAYAKISDWVSYIPVELHTQVRARIRSFVDPKPDEKRFTAAQVANWQGMDVLTPTPRRSLMEICWKTSS